MDITKPLRARLVRCLLVTLALIVIIGTLAPQQLPVLLFKLTLVLLAVWLGYWVDRALFPYARPHEEQQRDVELFKASMMRRAVIVVGVVLAVSLGL